MSEERAPYHAVKQLQQGEIRTCKNCGNDIRYSQHSGWRHVDEREPGYFGSDGFFVICGRPEPSEPEKVNIGPPSPELQQVITQVLHFPDGSRLRVLVDAPMGDGLSEAHEAYYTYLFRQMEKMTDERTNHNPRAAGSGG